MKKTVIFDLDGTLLDSIEDIASSMNKVLESLQLPIHKIEDYKHFVGGGVDILVDNTLSNQSKEIKDEDVQRLLTLMKDHSFGPLVAHAPYTMNVCAAKEDIRKFSVEMLKDDIRRMEYLLGAFYNFHPGSHVGQGSPEPYQPKFDLPQGGRGGDCLPH